MNKPVMPAAIHYPTNTPFNMGQSKHGEFSPVNSSSHCGFSAHCTETNIPNSLTAKDLLLISIPAIMFVGIAWVTLTALSVW